MYIPHMYQDSFSNSRAIEFMIIGKTVVIFMYTQCKLQLWQIGCIKQKEF